METPLLARSHRTPPLHFSALKLNPLLQRESHLPLLGRFERPLPFPLWLPFLFSNRGGVRNQPHPWLTDPYTTSLVHCCLISSFPVEVWFREGQTDISLTEEECNWARGEIEWSTKRLISFHWLTGRPGKSFDLTHLISRWEKKRIRAPPPYRMNKEFTIDDRAILRLLLTSPPPCHLKGEVASASRQGQRVIFERYYASLLIV